MTSRKTAEQLPLAFGHDPATGRDDLLVAEPVNAAVAMIDAWPHWPAPVVIIAGPVGSGKSHLAAIWREKAGAVTIAAKAGTGAEEAAEAGPVLIEDADRMGFDDPAFEAIEDHEALRPLLEALPDRERRIIELRFFRNLSQSQIAEELGISQMHVSRLLARTLAGLRAGLSSD